MIAEIIAVGTELLMGQIVNSNAQYLSRQFTEMGINLYYQTVVGDNASRMSGVMKQAGQRADLVIITGGLGPTQDDITKDVLAELVGSKIIMHEPTLARITNYFKERGREMVASNSRQALLIEGAEALMNDSGMAVGLAITYEGTHYILLPGPPSEMKPMFSSYARPWIEARLGNKQPLFSKMLKFAGIGESSLEDQLKDLITAQTDPTLAPYADDGMVTLRVTTRATNEEAAAKRMSPVIEEIKNRLSAHLYAEADVGIEQVIVEQMSNQGLTLSTAESCTGGLLSQMITAVPGSSSMFPGGVISYSNDWKINGLGVPSQIMDGEDSPGAVSPEAAIYMAEGIRLQAGSDFGVSITGVAGPSFSERKPVGLVYVAIASKNNPTYVEQLNLSGNREMIRLRAARHALYRLWQRL
jgi:nicotinamide-nucleotide amidase